MSRLNPHSAFIKERYLLTKPGSTKETYHIVLDITGLNLSFKVGDSIGVYGDNDPVLVDRLLSTISMDSKTPLLHPRTQKSISLKTFLSQHANISRLTPAFLKLFNREETEHTDIIDFLSEFGAPPASLCDFAAAFSPLLPRFYSIASSRFLHPNEIHLVVTVSSYMHSGEKRYGVASHFLAHLAKVGITPIPFYVQPALHFTLPQDHTTPIIMVGPGTGVAPFRGFIQERLYHKAPGKNWLFFGERHRSHDFLYEEFWNSLATEEKLSLDLAFSRDQTDKVYVQHKLLEKGAEIWSWIEQGAHFYVCGEADPMAKEVEACLKTIFEQFGNFSPEESLRHLKQLRKEKRYLADVY